MAAGAKRQKLDRTSNAAYAASQPLFSALRTATTASLPAQQSCLTVARDLVQSLHVKIADTDDTFNDIKRHEAYMDSIVKAWKTAVDSYCDIFSEMLHITGKEQSVGRGESARHGEFQAMLKTTVLAKEVVEEYEKAEGTPPQSTAAAGKAKSAHATEQSFLSSAEPVNGGNKRPFADAPFGQKQTISSERTEDQLRSSSKRQRDNSGPKTPIQGDGSQSAHDTHDPDGIDELNMTRKRLKRLDRLAAAKLAQTKAVAARGGKPHTNLDSSKTSMQQKGLPTTSAETESSFLADAARDVSKDILAEADRRLQAKVEKKAAEKAKKAEKKRKRKSGDSFVTAREASPLTALEESIVATQKPPSKKTKYGIDDETARVESKVANGVKNVDVQAEKRKALVDAGTGDAAGVQMTKKRKKSKS